VRTPDDATRQAIARTAKAWMAHRRLNPTDLHKRTGLSRDVIYRLTDERGSKGFPDVPSLVAFAREVGITPGQLLDGVQPPEGISMLPASEPLGTESRSPQPGDRELLEALNRLTDEVERLANQADRQEARIRALEAAKPPARSRSRAVGIG
jgi:predicted DNA-binding transcriptional regulator AlpA